MKLILPAAGKGTRMASVTQGRPKELLPLVGRTVADHVVEELPGASLGLVSSAEKPSLDEWGKARGAEIRHQVVQNGLAPALSLFFDGSEAVAVALPDTVFFPESPLPLLAQAIKEGADIAVAVEEIPDEKVSRYGICRVEGLQLLEIVEKPSLEQAPSRLAVGARYALSGRAQEFLAGWIEAHLPAQGELSISPCLSAALAHGLAGVVVPLGPRMTRFDCGSPDGYQEALRRMS